MLDRHVVDVVYGRFLVTIRVTGSVVTTVREELVHGEKGKRTKEKRKKKGNCKIELTRSLGSKLIRASLSPPNYDAHHLLGCILVDITMTLLFIVVY